jgi:hypothetical protein
MQMIARAKNGAQLEFQLLANRVQEALDALDGFDDCSGYLNPDPVRYQLNDAIDALGDLLSAQAELRGYRIAVSELTIQSDENA